MNSSEHFFPEASKWNKEDTSFRRAREHMRGERQKHSLASQVCSGDPLQAERAMACLKRRILRAVPPGTMYLEALMNISGYEWSTEIPSAGITCTAAPTFLLNPGFLDRYCILDTDLRMLILHELHHILYGHHILCGNMSPAKNVAFDAVINARLCKAWESPVHADFFRNTYKDKGFPEVLLCPPSGWPGQPNEDERKQETLRLLRQLGMKATTKVVRLRRRLYEPGGDISYEEILEVLRELGLTQVPLLLGNHTLQPITETDKNRVAYPFLINTARGVHGLLKEAERKSGQDRQAGGGGELFNIQISLSQPRGPFLNALRNVLVKAGVYRQHLSTHCVRKQATKDREMMSVVPDWRDRTLPARADLLGASPVLYRSSRPCRSASWQPSGAAHVYLDVSGSMSDDLPWIAGALRPLERNGLCRIFLFSTTVVPLPKGQLRKGRFASTGGTDIRCVLEHLTELPPAKRPRHAVVVTDGIFRLPRLFAWSRSNFKGMNVALHGAITHNGSESPFSSMAASITRLPAYK